MVSLVTGASGLLGSALLTSLSREGERVVAVGRRRSEIELDGVTWVEADLDTCTSWSEWLKDVDVVYHLAWSSLPHTASAAPAADASTNVVGTVRLLESLRDKPGTRFVFASSGGTVYGPPIHLPISENHPTRPISAYGVSKLAVERYLDFFAEAHGLDPVSMRIANLFGPNQDVSRQFGAIATFSANALIGKPIRIFGDGGTVRDYVFVSDVADALITAGQTRHISRALNVGTGQGRSLTEILDLVRSLTGRPIDIQYSEARNFDVRYSVLDVSRAAAELNWRSRTSFEMGVAATFEGVRRRLSDSASP